VTGENPFPKRRSWTPTTHQVSK